MLNSIIGTELTVSSFFLCTAVSLLLGVGTALVAMYRSRTTQSFAITLAILPAVVCVVILMVNGNVGTGVAVAGAFNLVRFRSIPGSAKDIGSVFLAMAVGLATGMGFLGLAVLFTAIIAVVNVVYVLSPLGRPREAEKTLKIIVPEDLEFDGIFDDVLDRFAAEHELTEVTTSNMGSLYTLEYTLRLREPGMEKRLIDEVRCLNGNLKVTLGKCELKPQGVL